MTPADLSSLNTVLVVIAVAVSIQTILVAGAIIAGVVAWRRLQARLEERYAVLAAQMDAALAHTRAAAQALNRASDEVTRSLGAVRHGLQSMASFVSAPKNLLMAGATSAVSAFLSRWRRRRHARTMSESGPSFTESR